MNPNNIMMWCVTALVVLLLTVTTTIGALYGFFVMLGAKPETWLAPKRKNKEISA